MTVAAIDTVDFIALTPKERIRVMASSSAAELWRLVVRVRAERSGGRFIERIWVGDLYNAWHARAVAEGRDPSALRRNSHDETERFWAHTIPGLDGCVIWDGPARFRRNGGRSSLTPQRWAWKHAGNELPPPGKYHLVRPTCGTESCVNIEHLAVVFVDRRQYRRDGMLEAARAFAALLGRTPTRTEWEQQRRHPVPEIIARSFGSWGQFIAASGLPPRQASARGYEWSDEQMLDQLRAWTSEHGAPPSKDAWQHAGRRPSQSTYWRRFGGWSAALKAAGLS